MKYKINISRLKGNLEELSQFGKTESGGITRIAFSEADLLAREWLTEKMETIGLETRIDTAGNVFGRLGSPGPRLLIGSHIDTVPEGGMFDGSLGVLGALECLQTIREKEISVNFPIEVVAFSDEEGAYHDFLGSRALTGYLTEKGLSEAQNMGGVSLKRALTRANLNTKNIRSAKVDPDKIRAYLELHIEQGPRLEEWKVPIGIVRSITGIASYWITFYGEADHSGTTPLNSRRDPLLGASKFRLKLQDLMLSKSTGVCNIGDVQVEPGVFNIVPKKVSLALEFRDSPFKNLKKTNKEIMEILNSIAGKRDLDFDVKKVSWDQPAILNKEIKRQFIQETEKLNFDYRVMDSGAGHDAQILSKITKVGLIFIPSRNGKSHCPEEFSSWNDVNKGVQLMLNTIVSLANE